MLKDIEDLNIPDADAFYNKKEILPPSITILAKGLVLNESVIQHDIFRLPNFTQPRYVVSEEFRQGIEKAKITGLSFEPLVDLVPS